MVAYGTSLLWKSSNNSGHTSPDTSTLVLELVPVWRKLITQLAIVAAVTSLKRHNWRVENVCIESGSTFTEKPLSYSHNIWFRYDYKKFVLERPHQKLVLFITFIEHPHLCTNKSIVRSAVIMNVI